MAEEHLDCQIAVVGSGLAGSMAARVLARQGWSVALLERGAHPRFALGESSTPLAAIALERLAADYGLADLNALAAYDRWSEAFPHLRRGLKRGFTFYHHHPGLPFANSAANDARLLVAASPNDRVADSHWLRQDVDQHLMERAVAEGVVYRDRVQLEGARFHGAGVELSGTGAEGALRVTAGFLLDASGGGGFLASHLPIAPGRGCFPIPTALVYTHLGGVRHFVEVAREGGCAMEPGPYPDERAAVHHLLTEGWMYVLPFDHGVVSAGVVLRTDGAEGARWAEAGEVDPEALWRRVLVRYPTLEAQLAGARPLRSLAFRPRLPHRLGRAVGERWLVLPSTYAFTDPMFSTGIAWSVLGVERVGRLFSTGRLPGGADLATYEGLLAAEADHVDRLIHGAYLAMVDLRLFAAWSLLYFAAASFYEAAQRLRPAAREWAWEGFLGARDEAVTVAVGEGLERLEALTAGGRSAADQECEAFAAWVAEAIAPRNIAGLADPRRNNLYPVDFAPLVERAHLLGLSREEVEAALPRLRG